MDGEHRSPIFAAILNLFIPGAIFWHFGHRWLGGSIIVLTLLILPVGAELLASFEIAAAIHVFLGVATAGVAFVVFARKDLEPR